MMPPMPGQRLAAFTCLALATPGQVLLHQVRSTSQSFQIDLPTGWRQLSPNEALRIGENSMAPKQLRAAQPGLFYAIGPVDEWLAGTFTSPWLYVVEQDNEWLVEDDFAARLAELWRAEGAATSVQHELSDIRRDTMGTPGRQVLTAHRQSTPKPPAPPVASLDVHAPAGGRQITLAFTCPAADFSRWEPEFRRWLATLVFARAARGEQKLSDRLLGPMVTGAIVTIVLVLLYKHTRSRR